LNGLTVQQFNGFFTLCHAIRGKKVSVMGSIDLPPFLSETGLESFATRPFDSIDVNLQIDLTLFGGLKPL
jgi:hypothetical protein